MKFILVTLTLLLSTTLMAENVKLRFSAIDNELKSEGLNIEQVQAKLRCHFVRTRDGGNFVSRRYPFTQYFDGQIKVKKSSLSEWLPGLELRSCAYILIVTGKDDEGRPMLGDIILMGKMRGDMSDDELRWMQNRSEADVYLNKRLEDMTLVKGKDERGRRRIIEKR